ncbi:hypothetical protein GE09DRAFT_1047535 [Coniochaeta sp. 2T2.1]|nr:hypothetical protein GE09DRAFT_1047535 [Coniochaeta sp. 2T2.1]
MTVENPFVATVRYVKRDEARDRTEKPYILYYAAPKGFPQNNFVFEPIHSIRIYNLRTAGLDYNEHGMTIAAVDDRGLDPDRFDDDMTVFDWMLRKRAPSFPQCQDGEDNVDAHQPSLSAHTDYTEAELDSRVASYFGAGKDKMLSLRYQVIKCLSQPSSLSIISNLRALLGTAFGSPCPNRAGTFPWPFSTRRALMPRGTSSRSTRCSPPWLTRSFRSTTIPITGGTTFPTSWPQSWPFSMPTIRKRARAWPSHIAPSTWASRGPASRATV